MCSSVSLEISQVSTCEDLCNFCRNVLQIEAHNADIVSRLQSGCLSNTGCTLHNGNWVECSIFLSTRIYFFSYRLVKILLFNEKKKTKKQTLQKFNLSPRGAPMQFSTSHISEGYHTLFVDFNIFPAESQTVDQQPQEKKTQHVIWKGLTMMPHPLVLTFKCNLDLDSFPRAPLCSFCHSLERKKTPRVWKCESKTTGGMDIGNQGVNKTADWVNNLEEKAK